jgi:hypothetical protein
MHIKIMTLEEIKISIEKEKIVVKISGQSTR